MITPKGYKILLSHERTNEFKKDLVVVPYVENSVRYPIFRISENYLYMPKFYGIDKLGLPELSSIKEQTGINYEFKFTGKLRDYQVPICNKILKHLNVNGSGLASLYTGWGKTCASLWILSQLGKKTLIIVHTENLLNQWKDRIKDFLGEEPGIIQGPKIEIDNHKIVIGMIQSISMKEYPPNTFKEFGFTIYDECFPADTYIHTNIGKLTIYKLFHIWNKEGISNNIEILSFNRETRVFEYKPLTYAWRKINYDLIKLTLSKQTIKCTLNHKILTSNGYVEANKLNIGDIVLSCYDKNHKDNMICQALNNDQLQVLYGSYLGDGNISQSVKGRYRLKIIHGKKQRQYCEWKGNMFGIDNIKYIKYNGYSKTEAYSFSTKCFDFNNSFENKTKIENGVEVSDWLMNNINEKGIAIWFMDDGSTQKHKLKDGTYSYYANIHSNKFDYESHLKFKNLFYKFNIKCNIKTSRKYYYLNFNKENTIILLNLIKEYIHEDLYYKLHNLSEIKYKWNNQFLEYGTLRITNKEYINNETGKVYDIEVKDNHNFIIATHYSNKINQYVDGPIVSNCHHTPGKAFSKIFYKIGTKYNLGLSATITRADGLTKVIKYFIGAVIVNLKLSTMTPKITFKYSSMEPLKEKTMVNGKINIAAMINDLCYSFPRTIEIVNIIKEKYKEGRKILILTDRRAHCTELKRLLGSDFENDIGLYLGSMKNEALQESNTKKIIIATYAMASEGYDNPELDTLILASPKSKIEQAVGRILRQENKNEPEVIDFVDSFSVFNNFYYARIKFYKSKKYIDKNKNINNDNDPNSNNDTKIESYSFIE